ncbi:hypothetical protein ACVXZ0_07240 [Staphylococcus aureus]
MLRRAVRFSQTLGINEPFMYNLLILLRHYGTILSKC